MLRIVSFAWVCFLALAVSASGAEESKQTELLLRVFASPESRWGELLSENPGLLDGAFFRQCEARIRHAAESGKVGDYCGFTLLLERAAKVAGRAAPFSVRAWDVARRDPDGIFPEFPTRPFDRELEEVIRIAESRRPEGAAFYLEQRSPYGSYCLTVIATPNSGSEWKVTAYHERSILRRKGHWNTEQTHHFFRSVVRAGVPLGDSDWGEMGHDLSFEPLLTDIDLRFYYRGAYARHQGKLTPPIRQFLTRFCGDGLGKLVTRLRWDVIRQETRH